MKDYKIKKNSFTIDISNLKKEKKRNKYSRSQKCLKLKPKELFNDESPFENSQLNNSFSLNSQKEKANVKHKNCYFDKSNLSCLYDEEINYDIETTNKNIHDTTDSSQTKKEKENNIEKGKINSYNYYNNNLNKTTAQKEYWFEEKNKYIQELEKKIRSQENSINNLIKYKKIIEEKFTPNNENIINFASLENDMNYDYSNKKMVKKLNRDDIIINRYNHKDYNKINLIKEEEKNFQYKYNELYSKYLQLNNDFKYLNNNKSHYLKEINQITIKYEKLQKEYKLLKNKYDEINNIIDIQRKEIKQLKNKETSNYKIQYILGGKEEKEVIKNLKQQAEVLKKDLVLSQAMVNSLKSEIEQLTKNNNVNNNTFDSNIITFNNNKNNSTTPIFKSDQTISFKDIYYKNNEESPQNLINSINNKNQLLTKVLEENNNLRNELKKYGSFPSSTFIIDDFNERKDEIIYKNTIKKYEEKFKYFNDYIRKMKINIQKIYDNIPLIFNKYSNKNENNILSDIFIFDLYDLRKSYNNIKKIDLYNLDITDDEKCINILTNIIKLLIEELEKVMKKIKSDTTIIPRYLNENIKFNENELTNNKINYNDLNINRTVGLNIDADNMLNKKENKSKFENNILNKDNKKKITFIPNFNDKKDINNTNKIEQSGTYNFEYGKNADNKFLENNCKNIL